MKECPSLLKRMLWVPGTALLFIAFLLSCEVEPHRTLILFASILGLAYSAAAYFLLHHGGNRCRWVSIPIALTIALSFSWTSQFLRRENAAEIKFSTAQVSISIEDQLEQRLKSDSSALARLADRMSSGIENLPQYWNRDAGNYVRDAAEYQAVEWISPRLKIQWVVPRKGNEGVYNLDLNFESRRREALGIAIAGRKPTISQSFELIQGGQGFIVYAPIYREGKFQGLIAGVLKTDRFIDSLPSVLRRKYDIRVFDGSREVYRNGVGDPLRQPSHASRSILPTKHQWTLVVAPNAHTLAAVSSPLVNVVFGLGLIVSAIVGCAVLLWEKATFLGEREKEARHFSQTLSESSIDMIFVTDLEKLAIVYCNKVGLDYFGVTLEEMAQLSFGHLLERVHPDDVPLYQSQRQKYENLMNGEVIEVEIRLKHVDGGYRWLHFHRQVMSRNANGDVKHILGTGHDVTARHQSEEATHQANLALEDIIDRAPIGMALNDLKGDWMRINSALCSLLGYSEEELLRIHFSQLTHPDDLEKDMEMMSQMIQGAIQGFSEEKRFLRSDGSFVWVELNAAIVRDANTQPLHFISQIVDISDRKRFEADMKSHSDSLEKERTVLSVALEKAEIDSKIDPLTQVFNRRWFDEQLEMLSTTDLKKTWSLIMVDVDHFKSFNDDYGHTIGDEVLKIVGQTIKDHLRDSDAAARYGGEEFVILCQRVPEEIAITIAERLRIALLNIQGFEKPVTASFGVASVNVHGSTPAEVLAAADAALYLAKATGRNRVCTAQAVREPAA